MARRSRRSREVELFNFSFLDILACVIGLLIFILSIVVVSSGGSRNRQTDGRVANAEHQLQQATEFAQRASDRRQKTEQILKEQSNDFNDPVAAAAAIRAQISLLNGEKARLDTAAVIAEAKSKDLSRALSSMGENPTVDPNSADIQAQLRRLDENTAALRNQAASARAKAQADVKTVQYYVPHLREIGRQTLWVDVSGDRLLCIESEDYDRIPIDAMSTRFTRVTSAIGTSVSAMVAGKARIPATLAAAIPGDTLLYVAVHPDGYEAFRKLRLWAWGRGFSVNWSPHDEDSITLTLTRHTQEQ